MCKWEMEATSVSGELDGQKGHFWKMPGWLTNSEELAELLNTECWNKLGGKDGHRHVHLIGGGLAEAAQKYPAAVLKAVLKALKKYLEDRGELSAFERKGAGPVSDQPNFCEDDVHGTALQAALVRQAREEELTWVRKEGIYIKVPLWQCYERAVEATLDTRWIDANKGDDDKPNYRSRIVVREIIARKKLAEQLPGVQLISATPPLKAFFLLVS
jgi:hypothetical protein